MQNVYEKGFSAQTEKRKLAETVLKLAERSIDLVVLDDRGGTGCFVIVTEKPVQGFTRRLAAGHICV